jgi:alkanesulfonate monooxygenase SsuD/methylene tetrahydromethanopterin reductase-like flavin-dependent oxidoreductase (luciferase family)
MTGVLNRRVAMLEVYMRFFQFSEQPYPDAWEHPSLRIDLANRHCDPQVASGLYNRYLDEWMLADELGLNIMLNEHHSTATCMAASVTTFMAILARQTHKARILALGVPIANRPDPLRVAEELAMIDVISRGRIEIGFVKGVPYEIPISNLNPVRIMDRFWEGHDLVLKALSTHDGPFRWEGEYYQYRSVNIWPRPWQQPHPPVWSTTLSPASAAELARRGHVVATVLTGYDAKGIFDAYRTACSDLGKPSPSVDRFGYLGLLAVGKSEAEANRRGHIVADYLRSSTTVSSQYKTPPGYFSVKDSARFIKSPNLSRSFKTPEGKPVTLRTAALEDLIAAGILFCGTPDQVFDQVRRFNRGVGGVGNIMLMGQAAALSHKDTADSLTLFAREVMPRLLEMDAEILAA